MDNKWISVNDQLPPTHRNPALSRYSETVILGAMGFPGTALGYWDYMQDEFTIESQTDNAKPFYADDITHWMPLPLPPAQE